MLPVIPPEVLLKLANPEGAPVELEDEEESEEPVGVDAPLLPPSPVLPTPGLSVKSESWVPSAIGPEGLARQEPGGSRGMLCPKAKGYIPLPPTAIPPTKSLDLLLGTGIGRAH